MSNLIESFKADAGLWVPHWPLPAGVGAAMSLRDGGWSQPPYASWNMGDHVGDNPAAVARNRERLAKRLGVRPVFLNQVHQTNVLTLVPDSPHGGQADGAVTRQRQVACTMMVADCLPVLMCLQDGSAVAAAHAGWRGLALGVLESTLAALQAQSNHGADDQLYPVSVWLGPCIGPDRFEVGDDVREAFVAQQAHAAQCFRPKGIKWLANLPALARQRLLAAGVPEASIHGNNGEPGWCTVSNESLYFSHRRDAAKWGASGRMAACIWRN